MVVNCGPSLRWDAVLTGTFTIKVQCRNNRLQWSYNNLQIPAIFFLERSWRYTIVIQTPVTRQNAIGYDRKRLLYGRLLLYTNSVNLGLGITSHVKPSCIIPLAYRILTVYSCLRMVLFDLGSTSSFDNNWICSAITRCASWFCGLLSTIFLIYTHGLHVDILSIGFPIFYNDKRKKKRNNHQLQKRTTLNTKNEYCPAMESKEGKLSICFRE